MITDLFSSKNCRQLRNIILPIVILAVVSSCNNKSIRKEFYSDGTLKAQYNLLNDKPDGLASFYSSDGKLVVEANYKNGLQEGLTKSYYSSGKIMKLVFVHDGIPQDTQKIYWGNGNIQEVCFLKDGEKNGEISVFFSNGKIHLKGTRLNGNKDGCWEIFDSITNRLRSVAFYKDNAMVSEVDTNDFNLKTFKNESLPFSISIPRNWKLSLSYPGVLVVAVKPNAIGEDSIPIAITVSNGGSLDGKSLQEYISANLKGLTEKRQLTTLINRENIFVNGSEYEDIIFIGNIGNHKIGDLMANILINNTVYIFSCTCPSEKIQSYKYLFEEMIKSIKFNT